MSSLPEGTLTYSGHARAIRYAFSHDVGIGTFTLEANFTDETASMSTEITKDKQFEFKVTNMVIDPSTGTFSTGSAHMGRANADLETAAIREAFVRSNAEGVHGIAYSNGVESPTYSGAFYGNAYL